ncbi:MAG: acyltransferase family protein [Pseudomonadota bacterium]
MSSQQRRYDLDWLRIIAFGLLIFYHIGMFYVSWGFHVKSVHAGPEIEPLMKLINPWRMTVLFLISGVALRHAMDKAPLGNFAWARFWRLFLPLVFGMLVVVAPQSWLELLEKGETTASFGGFYPEYLSASTDYSIILPTWNHLWYVAYLIVYTFILIGLYPLVTRVSRHLSPLKGKTPVLFAVVAIAPVGIFALNDIWLEDMYPSTHALVDDWGNHALYFPFLLTAFLIAKSVRVWQIVDRLFVPAVVIATTLAMWQLFVWSLNDADLRDVAFIEVIAIAHMMVVPIYAWACILVALGLVRRFANAPSRALNYMTEAIFPWYILHQTFIVIFGFWLTRQGLTPFIEFSLLTGLTFAACFIAHEYVIRRSNILRPFFGLKQKRAKSGKTATRSPAQTGSATIT